MSDEELLALSPIEGASDGDRVGPRRVRLFDDPAALRQHANEHTVTIILPGERLDELGSDWLADQFARGVMLVVLDIPAYPLMDILGIPREEPMGELTGIWQEAERTRHEGFSEPYYVLLTRYCETRGQPGYVSAGGGHFDFGALGRTLDGQLSNLERDCA